jgi:signal transduction histidine kinase
MWVTTDHTPDGFRFVTDIRGPSEVKRSSAPDDTLIVLELARRYWMHRRLRSQGTILVTVSAALLIVIFGIAGALDRQFGGAAAGGAGHLLALFVVSLAISTGALVVGMTLFTRGTAARLAVLAINAEHISQNLPLMPIEPLSAEVSRLSIGLEQASRLIRNQEHELRAALQEAQQANRVTGDFLSRVSHELRTPLNAMLGFGQLLDLGDDLTSEQREAVDHILRAGHHLLDVINDVLDVARKDADSDVCHLESVSVTQVFRDAVSLMGPLADNCDVRLLDDGLRVGPDLHVLADHQRLLQVLINLLSNAIKYNHRGGLVIASYEEAAAGHVRLEVTDSGNGIDMDDLDRLFTPFDRLGAEQTEVEGTGLGLSLSLRLLESMGGTLMVDSAVGVGSTFAVDLRTAERGRGQPVAVGANQTV